MNEDKLILLLKMTEQTESLSDKELAVLFSDKEIRGYYETMVLLKQTFQVSAESSSHYSLQSSLRNSRWSRYVATVAIVLLAMGSIILAAVYYWNDGGGEVPLNVETQQTHSVKGQELEKDSLPKDTSKKTYENETLEVILSDIVQFYGLDVKYSNDHTSSLRMHFVWNTSDDIDAVIDIFNHFDHIGIHREGKTLYVD